MRARSKQNPNNHECPTKTDEPVHPQLDQSSLCSLENVPHSDRESILCVLSRPGSLKAVRAHGGGKRTTTFLFDKIMSVLYSFHLYLRFENRT